MKVFFILAAALLTPTPAMAQQWYIYEQTPPACTKIETWMPGMPMHTPAELIAELEREGSAPTWQNFPATGKPEGVAIDVAIQGKTYEVDLFASLRMCRGFQKYEAAHPGPEATPDGDKTI